jgi:hypothetical protein
MSYMHINNLYRAQDILLFRMCYAMEKVHGTSAHVSWRPGFPLHLFAGGCKQEHFEAVFDKDALLASFNAKWAGTPVQNVTVYGEAYGGKMQAMSKTYGPDLRFIAFEVQIDGVFLNVLKACEVAMQLGFEFVPFRVIETDMQVIDAERDRPSEVAVRRGIAEPMPREGVVLRPLEEMTKNSGERVICKHKGEAFSERLHTPKVANPAKREILSQAEKIAEEWVTPMRLMHVLDKFTMTLQTSDTGTVIRSIVEDVEREAKGEILESKEARRAIGARAAWLFKDWLKKGGVR